MFNFIKIWLFSISLFTNAIVINNSLVEIDYNINNNSIEFVLTTTIVDNSYWWVGIGLHKELNINVDTIVCWNDISNTIQLDVFNVNLNNITIDSLVVDYDTQYPYLLYNDIMIENNIVITKFSRYLNTGNGNDVQIENDVYFNISIYKGNTVFPSTEQYYHRSLINIVISNNTLTTSSNSEDSFYLNMFYPSIFTFFIFFIFIFICIITQTTYIRNKYVYIYYIGYYSIGTIIFINMYTIWWLSMCTYCFLPNDSGEILFRLGIWIMLNTSSILMPITRNSIWIFLFKIPYLKIIHLHKYMSILCIISVIIKFITVLLLYPSNFLILLLNNETGGSPLAGTISTFCYIILGIFAIPQIRKKCFEIFYFSHRILSIVLIATSIWHYFISLYYILPALLLYIFDIIYRYIIIRKALYLKLDIVGNDEYNTTCIVLNIQMVDNITSYPGCYFLICIRNISSYEWHPISLVENKNNKFIFCVKDMGINSWTSKLKYIDNKNLNTVDNLFVKEVYLQGPYGSLNFDYSKYKYIINIAGGIGVTAMFSILHHINEMYLLKKLNKLEKILFIWIIPHASLLEYFNTYILTLNHQIINIEIYITKQQINTNYPLYIKNFKPDVTKLIERYIIDNNIDTKDISITTCGPSRLINDIKMISNKLNIDIFCEDF